MAVAIVSERIREKDKTALESEGLLVLPCPSCALLPAPIADHPDSILSVLGDTLYCYEGYYKENAEFFSTSARLCKSLRTVCLADAQGDRYSRDCAYNLLHIARHAFYNPRGLSPSLAAACKAHGFFPHPVHQGYAACTVCALGDSHAITADAGMAKALEECGIQTLLIREGGISLPPYAHGFIGGASGCFGKTVYFYGDLRLHPDAKAIEAFINAAGFAVRSLSEEPLLDLGGILFIE